MAGFLQALGNIGTVVQKAKDEAAKSQQQAQAATQRALQLQEQQQKLMQEAKQQQANSMAYGGLQGIEGLGQPQQGSASPPQNPMAPGQPSTPMQGTPPPPAAPQPPPGAPQMPSPAQQGAPPPGQIAPALTGAGGANLPAAFNVQQAMSYLQKQNPNADPATLFQALGQMGGMWEQLHPQAKQDYQLVRDNIKAQMQMDMLRERLNAIDEQIDRRGELAKIRDGILEQGRDRRASQSEQGKDARQNTRETGIENRFDKRQDWLDAKRSTKAATQDIADQKTEINDQISKLNKERAAIKNALPFGQAAPNSPEQKKLQELAKQIDDLSDKKIMLDRAMRQARVGGGKEPGAGPDATPREKEQGPGQQGDYKSADDVVAAYKNGKIDHDAASKILKENGWAE